VQKRARKTPQTEKKLTLLIVAASILNTGLLSHFYRDDAASHRPQRDGGYFEIGDADWNADD
jgi:hypothetical protein